MPDVTPQPTKYRIKIHVDL